ncbi:hypothetical protein ACLPJK_25655 [Pseudomonas aeruginosa]|uniref:hypothetical protein n=1 Tax=Pseudomonas aeruginosa TaxID=287 RepID=UPI003D2A1C95
MNWNNYFFHLNCTDIKEVFDSMQVGVDDPVLMSALANALNTIDKGEGANRWTGEALSAPFSTFGGVVIFKGSNTTSLPTKGKMKYVTILQMPTIENRPGARFHLTYN